LTAAGKFANRAGASSPAMSSGISLTNTRQSELFEGTTPI